MPGNNGRIPQQRTFKISNEHIIQQVVVGPFNGRLVQALLAEVFPDASERREFIAQQVAAPIRENIDTWEQRNLQNPQLYPARIDGTFARLVEQMRQRLDGMAAAISGATIHIEDAPEAGEGEDQG